jgi:hypothetical protein
MDISKYNDRVSDAVAYFWRTRDRQASEQKERNSSDQGNRGAVTGGKQMDGFIKLLTEIAIEFDVPQTSIHTKSNYLPGYFRPSKDWDLLITTSDNNLVCAIELKSQVGSFGNNFNNRTEEALGSSYDLSTSLDENSLQFNIRPWIGYIVVLEKSEDSNRTVSVQEKLFRVRNEFRETSYLQRYDLFCNRLMKKQMYNAAALLWTEKDLTHGQVSYETSIEFFLRSYISNLIMRGEEFK